MNYVGDVLERNNILAVKRKNTIFLFAELGLKPRDSHLEGKNCATEI
jgi:hypothetical protein